MIETGLDLSAPARPADSSPALESPTGLENIRNFIARAAQAMFIGAQSRAGMVLGCGVRNVPGLFCKECARTRPN
jgi:hypothetical protein